MSGSDWSPDDGASDVDEVSAAMNERFVEHLAQQHPPRVTQRRRSRSPGTDEAKQADEADAGPSKVEAAASTDVPRKLPRLDLAAMIGDALRKGDVRLLPADVTVEARAAQIVEALRKSEAGGEVAKAVTMALNDPLNVALREEVLTGVMSPAALVALDEVSLLNPEKRAVQEKARLDRLDQHSVEYLEKLSLTKTNMFTCPACGSHECFANFRSTDFVKWQGDDQTPTLLRCCKCAHSFRS